MENTWLFATPQTGTACEDLPDPFQKPDGSRVKTREEWPAQRAYLKEMLAHYLYGHMPPAPEAVRSTLLSSEPCHEGFAVREQVMLTFGPGDALRLGVTIIRPQGNGRHPVFVWNQFADMAPSPIEAAVCQAGYAIAMFDRNELARDQEGMPGPFEKEACPSAYPGHDWRAVAVWGWGHSVVASYLATTAYADMAKLISTGFSRGAKAALCAAIYDGRFAACAAAGSGCGGAANLRFMGGRLGRGIGACESLGDITKKSRFWHWFSDRCAAYGNHDALSHTKDEALLPFDLHFVRALIAPRPLITVDGLDDIWSNPYGIQVSWKASSEVYRFLGSPGHNAMRFREGGHGYSAADWRAVLAFCENTLRQKQLPLDYKLPIEGDGALPPMHFAWRAPEN